MNHPTLSEARTRVLVVDDSAFMRTALTRMISCEPDLQVVGAANSGRDALQKIAALDPDVVTLDISMPGLDGLDTLRRIMSELSRPVIMVSAGADANADSTLNALSIGAFDYVPKHLSPSSLDITHIQTDLVAKIRAAARSRRRPPEFSKGRRPSTSVSIHDISPQLFQPAVVAIGVSTGGPKALEEILPRFPQDFPLPILIVQHMPIGFTRPLAQRLDSLCSISVHEARHEEEILNGIAYIAPAGLHMCAVDAGNTSRPAIHLDAEPRSALHTPSVDILMKSVARVYRDRAIGVIMTGMGCDGAQGMADLFRKGALTIGQDQASCAVYGMPRACADLGVLSRIVPLMDIPTQIIGATLHRQPA